MRELNADELDFIAGGQDLYLAYTKDKPTKTPDPKKPASNKPESSMSGKELIHLCDDLDSQTTDELIERQRYLEDEIREREIANAGAGVVAIGALTSVAVAPVTAPVVTGVEIVVGIFYTANNLVQLNYEGELREIVRELEDRNPRGGDGD